MIVSIGGVLAAAAWAYYKVLSTPKETEHLGSPTPPLPENAEEYRLSLHYEGNPVELVETINDILDIKMAIKE